VTVVGRAAGRWRDVWPLGVLALSGFGVASARVYRGALPVGLLVVAAILATLPLLAVRRWPLAALGVVTVVNGGFVAGARLSWPVSAVVTWLVAAALAPVLLPRRAAVGLLVASEVAVLVAALLPASVNPTPWDATIAEALAVFAAWGAGESLRGRRASAIRQARITAQLRSAQEREAAGRGRAELARDLHDVVAHHVSLIAVRAAMAPYQIEDMSPGARHVLDDLAVEARTALAELRTVLGVLRSPEGAVLEAPQPSLAEVPALIERMRAPGMDIALNTSGEARPVAESVQLCCYRIVQEALTNAARHAPGARVAVELAYGPHDVAVRITNGGGGHSGSSAEDGPGFGLVGMRERVTALGGEFTAGPVGPGFEVCARIPAPSAVAQGHS
jgi:signal transduction histidine kinase